MKSTINSPPGINTQKEEPGIISKIFGGDTKRSFGQLVVGDFDADGLADLLLPIAEGNELQMSIWHCQIDTKWQCG